MWLILVWIAIVLTLGYCVLIFVYYAWFTRLKLFKPAQTYQPQTRFTVVIPARNEEANIEKCVRSVLQNEYPSHLFEVIVADDFSTDNTAGVVKNLQQEFSNLKLIRLADFVTDKLNSYKKKSIETAIELSSYEWI